MFTLRPPRLDSIGSAIVELGIRRPRWVITAAILITVVLAAATVRIEIDTDPENMLPGDDPVRVLNERIRDEFGTRDMIVLGIVDEGGVLTPETIAAASPLVDEIAIVDGVVPEEIVSFKSATDVPSGELSQRDVDGISAAVNENALFAGRVISPDGRGLAIYVPLEDKGDANDVSSSIEGLVNESDLPDSAETYLAGLPLAEEAFGRDMFFQMGLLAPLAGGLIFLLMLYFFRRLSLVFAAMVVAMLSVIWTMGLLIGTGFTVHIMSSMIPIFLMPIAILDSIHILSEFFDRYPHYRDRRETLRAVYKELFVPISFTSLTTAVAFASLALAPIPPVQAFGLFVAFGVFAAWLLTMLFIPAFVMLLSEEGLKRSLAGKVEGGSRVLAGGLRWMGGFAASRSRVIIPVFILLGVVAVPGLLQITVNDNPVRWFKPGSEIREATEVLTEHFPGTYNASLLVEANGSATLSDPAVATAVAGLQDRIDGNDIVGQTTSYVDAITTERYLASGRDDASRTIPEDQDGIERSLDSAAASPNLAAVSSLLTDDYRRANIQILMKDGDNQAMQRVVDDTESYLDQQPLPDGVSTEWAGETYLNLVWQDKMVTGMLRAFLSTFLVVLVLMILLFRSLRWALLAMVPMSFTILLVYGILGFVGKDYDMPLAVLSTLVLGIGVDFAIHFVQRYRELLSEVGSANAALSRFFEEPARALTRNALIIAIGFVPLFFASLVPYIVVGVLLASIMILSWLATLILLPAVISFFSRTEYESVVGVSVKREPNLR
jgi:predicted RND superfamily exporter protein